MSLERALRKLAHVLTGKPYNEIPESLEQIIRFIADNFSFSNPIQGEPGEKGEQGEKGEPGEKGEQGNPGQDGTKGQDGLGVKEISLVTDDNGAIISGVWIDTEEQTHEIIIKGSED